MKGRRLLVLGGTNVLRSADGRFVTKAAFSDYLHELAGHFDSCAWMAPLYDGPAFTSGLLDINTISLFPFQQRNIRSLISTWCRIVLLSLGRPYVLVFHASSLLPVFPIVKTFSKCFVAYLGVDYRIPIEKNLLSTLPGWRVMFRLGHECPLKWADAVITRGKHLASVARQFNSCVFETVPIGQMNAPNASAGKYMDDGIRCRLLFVGKVLRSKGVDDLLLAFNLLLKGQPHQPWRLDIVGEGDDRAELEEWAHGLALEGVKFHGWIDSGEELEQLFAQADVLVCPSAYPEGVPRVIDEALTRGVPVVTTRVGGIPEEFSDGEVLLVEPNAPERLATAIEAMLCDSELRRGYIVRATRRREVWKQHGSAASQHVQILLGRGMKLV